MPSARTARIPLGAAGHVLGRGDALVCPGGPLAAEVSDWRRFLAAEEDAETLTILRRHGRTGRPWADPRFLARLEKQLSRRPAAPADPGKGNEKIGIASPEFPRKGQ